MNPDRCFDFRALELHGVSIWDVVKVRRALEAIRSYGMNALVLHESDMTNRIVFPTAYFDAFGPWKDAPLRRGENAIHNDRIYIRSLLRLAADYGVGLWLELKELTFSDEILERFPQLIKNGTVCPTEPVWFNYIETKYAELVRDFPGLKGIILSPGSPEGRSSLSQRKCGCPTCAATDMTGIAPSSPPSISRLRPGASNWPYASFPTSPTISAPSCRRSKIPRRTSFSAPKSPRTTSI
jgi:hypothetical protein